MRNPEDFIGETLLGLPWWLNILLAGIIFILLYYVIPAIKFENPILSLIATFVPVLAFVYPVILIIFAIMSALKSK